LSGKSPLEQAGEAMSLEKERLAQLWAAALRRDIAAAEAEALGVCEGEVDALIAAVGSGELAGLLARDAALAQGGRGLKLRVATIRALVPSCSAVLKDLDEDARREALVGLHDLCLRRLEALFQAEEDEGTRRLAEAQDQALRADERAQALARENESLRKAEARTRHRAEQLALLSSVTRHIAGILDPDRLMQEAANAIQSRMEHTYVAVVTLGADGGLVGRWSGRSGFRHETSSPPTSSAPIRGVIGRALRKRSPQVVRDVLRDPDYLLDVEGTRSEMAVPLIDGGRAVGALDFQSESPEAFDLDDVVAAEILAEFLVVALRNARLFTARGGGSSGVPPLGDAGGPRLEE
jgi:GAF domain-containing protein